MLNGNPANALHYLTRGAGLLVRPGLKRFVLVPLLVNLVLFVVATIALVHVYRDLLTQLVEWMPEWLAFVAWILWLLFAFLLLVVYGYTFNIITNLVAAPFYGILAEKIEQELTGKEPKPESLSALIPRTLARELTKLWYFVSRGSLVLLVLVVLWFIPVVNLASALISVLWAAWCMSVQYIDYPADNHQLEFREMRRRLNTESLTSYTFGGLVMAGSMIPLVNIFMMPIAVAGATIYWVEELSIKEPSIKKLSQ